jgi:hypothetical protein
MRVGGLVALAAVVAVAGCGIGNGTGTLSGSLFLSGCTHSYNFGALGAPATYNMDPSFFVANPINALASSQPLHPINKVSIRMQPSGNIPDESDIMFFTVANDAEVAAALGQPIDVGATSNVRATLTLNQTCPDAEVLPVLVGAMTWQSFGGADATNGVQFGDRLAATFSFDVVDQRAISIGGLGGVPITPAASGHLTGSFDFIVRQGKAAQPF